MSEKKSRKEKAPSNFDAFELLLPTQSRRKWHVDKTYHRKSKSEQKTILPFQNADTKEMIVQWLSNTQNKFGRLTQSEEIYDFFDDDDNKSFSLPSVSQNKAKLQGQGHKVTLRTQKVVNGIVLRSRKVVRPRSLDLKAVKTRVGKGIKRQNLSFEADSCDYNIEEFDTGPKIGVNIEDRFVQKNIIEQLEDDFLDSIETEVDIMKYNPKVDSVLSSGWDRMKEMKKTACKGKKQAKKLKALVQVNPPQPVEREKKINQPSKALKKNSIVENSSRRSKNKVKTNTRKSKLHPVTVMLNKLNKKSAKEKSQIIDLTVSSPEKQMATAEREVSARCEVMVTDISELANLEEIQVVAEEINIEANNLKVLTPKNKFLLKETSAANLGEPQNDIIYPEKQMTTAEREVSARCEVMVTDILELENLEEIQVVTEEINIDLKVLTPKNKLGEPPNHIDDIFLLSTPKATKITNNEANIYPDDIYLLPAEVSESAIPLEIERLRKLVQTSIKLEKEHKNVLESRLDDFLQNFLNSFNGQSAKTKVIATQTDEVLVKDASEQVEASTKTVECQTVASENLASKFSQTIEVLNVEKSVQTKEIERVEIGVQVGENDLKLSPEKQLLNSLARKYLGTDDVERNKLKGSRKMKCRNEDPKFNKSILTEDITSNDELNNAICLTESDCIFSKPNSPAKITQTSSKTQAESIGIISQTQFSNLPKKSAPIQRIITETSLKTQVESSGIISQTQFSNLPKKCAPIESIGIISQTQLSNLPKKSSPIESIGIITQTQPQRSAPVESVGIITQTQFSNLPKKSAPIQIENVGVITEASAKAQVESITQTQLSNIPKKSTPIETQPQKSAPVESIGIITQTQMNRPPIKLHKAKLPSPQITASPKKARIEEELAELSSDSLDNIEFDTADILAGGNITSNHKTLTTHSSNIEISVVNKSDATVNRKLDFDKANVKRMKRIRFPADSDDSDDEQLKPKKRAKNKFVRDDLSIEFQTERADNYGREESDNLLPDELPDVCFSEYADDFNFADCLRNIENNFDPNVKKITTPQKSIGNEKPSTSSKLPKNQFCIPKINEVIKKIDDALIFKSPVSNRAKRSILSEIICPNDTEKNPGKVKILENIVIQNAVNKSSESDVDLDDVICSDESFDENTKFRTVEPDVAWNTPKKKYSTNDNTRTSPFPNIFALPSLGGTPDMLNLPPEGEEVFLPPPAEFANSAPDLFSSINGLPANVNLSAQDPKIDSTVNTNTPNDTSTQRNNNNKTSHEEHDYDISSLSPIKPEDNLITEKETIKRCALTIIKRDKPKAKPLNISNHSTPKVKQNSIYTYLKRTQNRVHLNASSSSLFHETEEIMNNTQTKVDSPSIHNNNNNNVDKIVPCIACSRLIKDDVIAVTGLVRKKLITFRNSFEKSVTHLIVSVNKSNFVKDHTMKYISAVSAGIWILNSDWIKACIRRNEIVDEEPYEVLDVSGSAGPKESRLYREIRPLLSKFRILAAPPFRASERSVIEEVIRNLGGSVADDAVQFLNKSDKINLVVKEALSTQSFSLDEDWLNVYKVATVDIEWLSRSVGQYKTLSFLPFLLCDSDDLQDLHVYPQEFLIDIPGFTFSTQPETES